MTTSNRDLAVQFAQPVGPLASGGHRYDETRLKVAHVYAMLTVADELDRIARILERSADDRA